MSDKDQFEKEILKVLKAQSEAMLKMNENIARLEERLDEQQNEVKQLTESLSSMLDQNKQIPKSDS